MTVATEYDEIATDAPSMENHPAFQVPGEPEPEPPIDKRPMLEENARVKLANGKGYGDVAGVVTSCRFKDRSYAIMGNNGMRFRAPEADVERQPAEGRKPDHLPVSWEFEGWFDLMGFQPSLVVESAIQAVMRANGGKVPADLHDEALLQAFAGCPNLPIPLPQADIESAHVFPHRHWASRAWTRATYAKFLEFCLTTGWLTTEDLAIQQPVAVEPSIETITIGAEKPKAKKAK